MGKGDGKCEWSKKQRDHLTQGHLGVANRTPYHLSRTLLYGICVLKGENWGRRGIQMSSQHLRDHRGALVQGLSS